MIWQHPVLWLRPAGLVSDSRASTRTALRCIVQMAGVLESVHRLEESDRQLVHAFASALQQVGGSFAELPTSIPPCHILYSIMVYR